MKRQSITEIIAAIFIILFIYASFSKLLDFEKFRVQLGQSPLLTSFSWWFAWIVPSIEIGIAILLAIPICRLIGLYASFSLMVMFTTYIIIILNFSHYVPCSCGGIISNFSWSQHLIFNIAFVLLALSGIIIYHKPLHKGGISGMP